MSAPPQQTSAFPTYLEMPQRLPGWIWQVGRCMALSVAAAAITLLLTRPELGLTIVWAVLIPSLPLIFALAPGLWRNLCPLAFANQIPRMAGFTRARTLPAWAKSVAPVVAMALFFGLVALRKPVLSADAQATAALLATALVFAFAGGLVFKGRSGWCGTFCPLGPIQRVYGLAPLTMIRNGYCKTCVGCQKNCYDFNPRAAIFSDLNDRDPWYVDNRKFFAAALPGFILGFFTAPSPDAGLAAYCATLLQWPLISVGLFYLLRSVTRLGAFRLVALFGMSALVIFYWFVVPVMAAAIADLAGGTAPDWTTGVGRMVVIAVAPAVVARGMVSRRDYRQAVSAGSGSQVGRSASDFKAMVDKALDGHEVLERTSGRRVIVKTGQSLLESLEAADLPIEAGCRMGVCGADPVMIVDGADNLPPPSEAERDTLRRLGLEGVARMACSCRPSGPATIDLTIDKSAVPKAEAKPKSEMPDEERLRVVIIGNGVGGITVAENVRQMDPTARIDILSRESHHFYNRMGLGRVVYGRSAMGGLYLMSEDWYAEQEISVWLNTIVNDIDRDLQLVHLGTRESLPYDRLVLATGASAVMPEVPGTELDGCFVLREADDASEMRTWSQSQDCRNAVVVGGGVLGIEAADALQQLGLHVTIVQRSNRLMGHQLDRQAAEMLARFLRAGGMSVLTGSTVDEISGDDRVRSVRLNGGEVLPADICLYCAGVSPNTGLAREAGLDVNRGVIVDEAMRTSDPNIFAVGDVAEPSKGATGLWPVAGNQGKVAAAVLLGRAAQYEAEAVPVHLKVKGIDVRSFGTVDPEGPEDRVIAQAADADAVWRRIVLREDRVIGGVFIGDAERAGWVMRAIGSRRDVSGLVGDIESGDWEGLRPQ